MAYVTSEPKKINVEDVQFSTSVSEAVANKIGAVINYIVDNFIFYSFSITGNVYSGLTLPYTFNGNLENIRSNCTITDIEIFQEYSGLSGTSSFRIERQLAAGGSWTTIFSTNCSIASSASANLSFSMNDSNSYTGVTKPVLSISNFSKSDKIRWVLVSSANQALNLSITVITRPI